MEVSDNLNPGTLPMIILHACVSENRLFLWGETPVDAEIVPVKPRGRKPKTPRPQPFLYDAGVKLLSTALKSAGLGIRVRKTRVKQATAWLPTKAGVPLASSQLVAEAPKSRAKSNIAPYTLTAISSNIEETIDLLGLCMGKQILAPGAIVGRDLMFWAQTLRFAGSLVARQQFLPELTEKDGTYRALWGPVFAGDDAKRLAKVAKEMPAVARALSTDTTISPPELHPQVILSDFIAELTDHLVRTAISEKPPSAKLRRRRKKKASAFDSIHGHWLHALRAPNGVIEGDKDKLAQLAVQMSEWRRPISIFATSPFRLCFRLEEPEGEEPTQKRRISSKKAVGDKWYLRYLLQAVDGPSLMFGVEDALKAKGWKASVLRRRGFNPKEFVLSSLGQALSICPLIEESLKTSAPSGCDLDTVSAHEFLTEKAMVLQQVGFGVILPAWWTRKGTKARLAMRAKVKRPRMSSSSGLSLGQIMKVDWEVALGDEKLTLQELSALAKLKAPLVKVRGQWVELRSEEIQSALDFWKKKATASVTVRDIIQMSLGATKTAGEIALGGVEATGWVADLLAQLEGRTEFGELSAPQYFQGTLRPYQVRGYSWLAFLQRWGLGACLADDMGLGQTIQTLAMIQRDWESNGNRPALLICPTSVLNNWQKEAARFTPSCLSWSTTGLQGRKVRCSRRPPANRVLSLPVMRFCTVILIILRRWPGWE